MPEDWETPNVYYKIIDEPGNNQQFFEYYSTDFKELTISIVFTFPDISRFTKNDSRKVDAMEIISVPGDT